jgi:hypothetical protein
MDAPASSIAEDGLRSSPIRRSRNAFDHNGRGDRAAVDAEFSGSAQCGAACRCRPTFHRAIRPSAGPSMGAAPHTTVAMMNAQCTASMSELEGNAARQRRSRWRRRGDPGRGEHAGAGEDAAAPIGAWVPAACRRACPCAAGGGLAGSGGRAPPTPWPRRCSRGLGGADHPPVAGGGAVLPCAAGDDAGPAGHVGAVADGEPVCLAGALVGERGAHPLAQAAPFGAVSAGRSGACSRAPRGRGL